MIYQKFFHQSIGVACVSMVLSFASVASELNEGVSVFNAKVLRLHDIDVALRVMMQSRDDIEVRLTSSSGATQRFSAEISDHTLVLTQRDTVGRLSGDVSVITLAAGGGNNQSYVTIDGKTVAASGNGIVVIAGSSSVSPTKLDIAVPADTAIEILDHSGEAILGDMDSSLALETSGTVRTGKLTRARVRALRNSHVDLASVDEHLELIVSGNAKVVVSGGTVAELDAHAKNNARVSFQGRAERAHLEATGNARILVGGVAHEPHIKVSRNAKVEIGQQ